MLSPQGLIRGLVARALPSANLDNQNSDVATRLGRYGDVKVESAFQTRHLLADEGCQMSATMLPGATALQLGLSAAFSAVAAAIAFTNSASKGDLNAKRCYLDYIRFLVSVVPTAATQILMASVVDDKDRTPTTISNAGGGSGPGTPATATAYRSPVACTNMDLTPAIVGVPYFPLSIAAGAPPAVPSAGPNARTIVGNGSVRAQIPVALDEYTIQFGNVDNQGALVTAAPNGASRVAIHHPAIVVGPAQWYLLYLWGPSNITAGLAFSGLDMGWIER